MDTSTDDLGTVIDALTPVMEQAIHSGGRLPPERALTQMLNVSRRRLRLALDELQRRGTVFRRHGQGTFVTPPTRTDNGRQRLMAERLSLEQLMDVRRQIEPHLARLAATHASGGDIEQLRLLMQRSRDAHSAQDYDLADEVFHYRIAELARNPLFLEIFDLIRGMRQQAGWRARRAETNVPEVMRILGQQHQQIFNAIAEGDAAGADLAQRLHIDFVASAIYSK
ncbi:FadR/GntR family transcriptional regulator [Paracoccus sp. R86501]|uniref:FadR/GntR family transcriptional regulator n=1 Tax=Paracoccus sp. R86501 TaxID=3101711 RepID=UPI00366D2D61